jgi:hypothetical protein
MSANAWERGILRLRSTETRPIRKNSRVFEKLAAQPPTRLGRVTNGENGAVCGSLRVIASGEPERVYVCHCRACQHRTGAVVHSRCTYLKSQVRIEGDNKIYERDADSGFKIRFHFCPNCGSNVFWEGDRNPNTFGITVGSFADPNFPPPTSSAWEEVMHPWLGVTTATSTSRRVVL